MLLVSSNIDEKKQYAKDPDDAIFGSWIFHQYFDALNLETLCPELAVTFESIADEPERFRFFDEEKSKSNVNVSIIFRDEDVARVMSNYFKNGTVKVSDLNFTSYLYDGE